MRVYVCTTHSGAGATSVVVARDEFHARLLLGAALAEADLRWRGRPEFVEVETDRPAAFIVRPLAQSNVCS